MVTSNLDRQIFFIHLNVTNNEVSTVTPIFLQQQKAKKKQVREHQRKPIWNKPTMQLCIKPLFAIKTIFPFIRIKVICNPLFALTSNKLSLSLSQPSPTSSSKSKGRPISTLLVRDVFRTTPMTNLEPTMCFYWLSTFASCCIWFTHTKGNKSISVTSSAVHHWEGNYLSAIDSQRGFHIPHEISTYIKKQESKLLSL